VTPSVRAAIDRARAAQARLVTAATARPIDFVRWTPPQLAFLQDPNKRKLLRLGQQVGGKTTAGLAELIWRCEGEHPHIGPIAHPVGRPYQAWVVCYSDSQSLQIQSKLAALLPSYVLEYKRKGRIVNEYRGVADGFRGKYKSVTFPSGATIIFKTTKQGPQALASGTVDCILVDEPTSPACWGEILGRVRRTGGVILLTLTPYGYPTEFLQAEVSAGNVIDHRYDLTEENVTPLGGTGPLCTGEGVPMDAAWIERQRRETPEAIRGVVLDGHWEQRGVARYFSCFDQRVNGAHISTSVPTGDVELRLGIDHGDRPGKQIVVLLAIQHLETRGDVYADRRVAVWVLDEYTDPTGLASPADDARGILDMLARHGQTWTDLHYVMGDRVHMPGSARQKSNKDLSAQLSRLLGVPRDSLRPAIYTVKKSRGNLRDYVGTGARWIYQCMAAPGGFHVHPRCESVIWALNSWTGPGPDCPEKDPVDALRYGLETLIFGGIKAGIPEIVSR
jgi:hypothetical protein